MLSLTAKDRCCAAGSKDPARRLPSILGSLLPGAGLLLVPKCPLCIVGYVAAFTGINISITAAAGMRYGMISLCLILIAFLLIKAFKDLART